MRKMRKMRNIKHNTERIILLALFVLYLMVLFKITIFRDSNSSVQGVNLIPFVTISEYLQFVLSGNKVIGIMNIVGNLIIFFPLGYMSALLFPKMRNLTRILILALTFSVVIEISQYIAASGSTDIDDVLLNVLGGVMGYGVYFLTSRFFRSKKYAIFMSTSMIAVTCIGFLLFSNDRFLLPMPGNLPARAERYRHNEDFKEAFPLGKPSNAPSSTVAATTDDSQSNTDEIEWHLILVNKWNTIPVDYEVELAELSNGQWVDKRIEPALQEMFDTAKSDGIYPIVASGYRTAEVQQRLMDEKIAEYRDEGYAAEEAKEKAEAWVALPGTSEHQLGISVDINADGIHSAGYEVYEWLSKNAYKFGFIVRYPADKIEITGVINEPWHYRYVGMEAATAIYNQGVCLEEYLNDAN